MTSTASDCPHCGCNDVAVIRCNRSAGRLCSGGQWSQVRLTTMVLGCNHCGRRWTEKDTQTLESEAPARAGKNG